MAKVQVEIEALNENCAKCPHIDGTYYQELICTRLEMCSAVSKINEERSENNGS